jgi:hypothetical protein
MNKNDNLVEQLAGDRPVGTVLRLVPPDKREQHKTDSPQHKTDSRVPRKQAAGRNIPRPPGGSDDDPGADRSVIHAHAELGGNHGTTQAAPNHQPATVRQATSTSGDLPVR